MAHLGRFQASTQVALVGEEEEEELETCAIRGKRVTCFNSGEFRHIARQCRKKRTQGQAKEKFAHKAQQDKQFVVCTQIGTPLQHLTVFVCHKQVQALVDSRAQVSVMSQQLSDQLPGGEQTQAQVVGANKAALKVLGTRQVQIKLSRNATTEECIVVASLNTEFILGLTAQKKLKLSIHPDEQCVCED